MGAQDLGLAHFDWYFHDVYYVFDPNNPD